MYWAVNVGEPVELTISYFTYLTLYWIVSWAEPFTDPLTEPFTDPFIEPLADPDSLPLTDLSLFDRDVASVSTSFSFSSLTLAINCLGV